MTDSEIEQWVVRELRFAGNIESRELCVSSQQGIVTLGGTVPSRISKVAAKRAALRARGVKNVVNNLRSVPSSRLRVTERVMPRAGLAATQVVSAQKPLSDSIAPIY
jgi:hypothetical protein